MEARKKLKEEPETELRTEEGQVTTEGYFSNFLSKFARNWWQQFQWNTLARWPGMQNFVAVGFVLSKIGGLRCYYTWTAQMGRWTRLNPQIFGVGKGSQFRNFEISTWLLAQLPSSVVPTGVWQDHHGWDRGLLRCPTSPEFMSIPTVEAFFFFGCTPMFIHKFMNVNSGCWNSKVAYLPWFIVILNHVISTIQELDQSI